MKRSNPALDEARHTFHKANDIYETGYVTFEYKKMLLELQWFLDEHLPKCSSYAGEEEWISDRKAELALEKISRSG